MRFNGLLVSGMLISGNSNKREAFVSPFYNSVKNYRKLEPVRLPMEIPLKKSIRDDLWDIQQGLSSKGFKVYIVGGAVRDLVSHSFDNTYNTDNSLKNYQTYNPNDFDLVTDANPMQIQNIFEKAAFVSNILNFGESFGVKSLETKSGNTYEIATLRKDIGGGQIPNEVEYQTELIEDAKRRDLTINALYYDIKDIHIRGFSGEVIDYVGGIKDIKNKVINPIGNSNTKFCEDPIRKIRTLRFAAKTSSQIPEDVSKAIRYGKTSIIDRTGKKITNEHLNEEFYKGIVTSNHSKKFLELLYQFDFYKHIFGKLDIDKDSFVNDKNPVLTMASILKNNCSEEIEKELLKHKFSRSEITSIVFLKELSNLSENNVSHMKKFYLQNVSQAIPQINGLKYPITPREIFRYASKNNMDKVKITNFIKLITKLKRPSIVLTHLNILPGKEMGHMALNLEKEFFKDPEKVSDLINSKDWSALRQILT